ncbi:hypothetical protein NQZ79_g8684 [Umbelopsis isabellina]|nr:hypothetical protein NQZ79_g8684 [Umbelopsis isabellina]
MTSGNQIAHRPQAYMTCLLSPELVQISHKKRTRNTLSFDPCYNLSLDIGDGPLTEASYLQDGFLGRAVNGPTWAEYLAVENGIDLYDFAVAGATANNTNVPRGIPDVQQQVQQYLTYIGNTSLPFESTLYAIWIGVNDIHDIYTTNNASDQRSAKVEIAAESVLNAVKTLYQKSKARRFLLPATPPIGYLPILTNGSSSAHHQPADELAQSFNHRVKKYLAEFKKENQDAEIQIFNSYFYIMNIIKDPTDYGLNYSIEPCTNIINGTICTNSTDYLWWDGWHPTTGVEAKFAAVMSDSLFGNHHSKPSKYVKTLKD